MAHLPGAAQGMMLDPAFGVQHSAGDITRIDYAPGFLASHADAVSSAHTPELIASDSDFGGLPSIDFDGTAGMDVFGLPDQLAVAGANPLLGTMVAWMKRDTLTGTQYLVQGADDDFGGAFHDPSMPVAFSATDGRVTARMTDDAGGSTSAASGAGAMSTTPFVLSVRWDATTLRVWTDGTQRANANHTRVGPYSLTRMSLGVRYATAVTWGDYFIGKIARLFFVPVALSDTDLATAESLIVQT